MDNSREEWSRWKPLISIGNLQHIDFRAASRTPARCARFDYGGRPHPASARPIADARDHGDVNEQLVAIEQSQLRAKISGSEIAACRPVDNDNARTDLLGGSMSSVVELRKLQIVDRQLQSRHHYCDEWKRHHCEFDSRRA